MRKYVEIAYIILFGLFVIVSAQATYNYIFCLFQTGWNDTAWVDTLNLCIPCSTGYDYIDCLNYIDSILTPDTIATDSIWHGFLLRFLVFDSSLNIWDTYYVNDTDFCGHGLYGGIPYCYIFSAQGCWSPACSVVYGYNCWYIPLSGIPLFSYLNDGDSICFLIIKGDSLGYKCKRYDDDSTVVAIRLILDDTLSLNIKHKKLPQILKDDNYYDILGRRIRVPKRSGIYIKNKKKIIIIK